MRRKPTRDRGRTHVHTDGAVFYVYRGVRYHRSFTDPDISRD